MGITPKSSLNRGFLPERRGLGAVGPDKQVPFSNGTELVFDAGFEYDSVLNRLSVPSLDLGSVVITNPSTGRIAINGTDGTHDEGVVVDFDTANANIIDVFSNTGAQTLNFNFSTVQVANVFGHFGDSDTFFAFILDKITCKAGNIKFWEAIESTQDEFIVNPDKVDVDFLVHANSLTNALSVSGLTGLTTAQFGLSFLAGLRGNSTERTASFTALTTDCWIACRTASASITVTLPASPAFGQILFIMDIDINATSSPITINRNGNNINNLAVNPSINADNAGAILIFDGDEWFMQRIGF